MLDGIHAAKRVGFHNIKLNAVSMRGITEHEVAPLAHFARQHGLEMRFIEYMPIGDDHWERGKVYFAHEILEGSQRRSVLWYRRRTMIRAPRPWSFPTSTAWAGSASSPRYRGRSA